MLDVKIPCSADKKFNLLRAEKTIVNSCLNALSAVENKPFCDLFSNKNTRKRIDQLFDECYNVLGKKYNLDKKEKMRKKMVKQWSKLRTKQPNFFDITAQ